MHCFWYGFPLTEVRLCLRWVRGRTFWHLVWSWSSSTFPWGKAAWTWLLAQMTSSIQLHRTFTCPFLCHALLRSNLHCCPNGRPFSFAAGWLASCIYLATPSSQCGDLTMSRLVWITRLSFAVLSVSRSVGRIVFAEQPLSGFRYPWAVPHSPRFSATDHLTSFTTLFSCWFICPFLIILSQGNEFLDGYWQVMTPFLFRLLVAANQCSL